MGIGLVNSAAAHTAGGPIGFDASATDLAAVHCFNDGNGEPDNLTINIEDLSPPQPGLLMSMQVFKGDKMTNITDTISGDGKPSASVSLKAGKGTYFISVNKTGAGVRTFSATWHCNTSNNLHTGSEVDVLQIQ